MQEIKFFIPIPKSHPLFSRAPKVQQISIHDNSPKQIPPFKGNNQ